jgi:hypothetical protein
VAQRTTGAQVLRLNDALLSALQDAGLTPEQVLDGCDPVFTAIRSAAAGGPRRGEDRRFADGLDLLLAALAELAGEGSPQPRKPLGERPRARQGGHGAFARPVARSTLPHGLVQRGGGRLR